MRETFPAFESLVAGKGTRGELQLIGLASPSLDNNLYLAAWQASSNGAWMVPSYNALKPNRDARNRTRRYKAAAVGNGNSNILQVVGLDTNGHVHLAAFQGEDGRWNPTPDFEPLGTNREYQAIALGNGNSNHLQVVGLGADGDIHLVAYQDKDGNWHRTPELRLTSRYKYKAIALASDHDKKLQVIGLTQDNRIHWATSLDQGGNWHPAETDLPFANGHEFQAIAVGRGHHKHLEIIGLGIDGFIYRAGYQNDRHDWVVSEYTALDKERGFQAIAVANGNGDKLQVIGLAQDKRIYLAAYLDGKEWKPKKAYRLGPDHSFSALAVGNGNKDHLQVFGVSFNTAVAAWQDGGGEWHHSGRRWAPSGSLSQRDDRGRWHNTRPSDVLAAFNAIGTHGEEKHYSTRAPKVQGGHYQGMAEYKGYYLLTHDLKIADHGYVVVLDKETNSEVQRFDTPEKGYNHPGGCQVIGDYLAVELEKGEEASAIRFYWLGGLTNSGEPALLQSRFETSPPNVAGAIGITDVGHGDDRHYVIVLRTDEGATFYRANNCLLDDPDLRFDKVFSGNLRDGTDLTHGADNLFLLTDANDQIYMIALSGEEKLLTAVDYADLYRVDLEKKTMYVERSRHMVTTGVGGLPWAHFRFGASATITDKGMLRLYCCGWNEFTVFPVNVFD